MSLKFVLPLCLSLILLANTLFFSCEYLFDTEKKTPPLESPPYLEVSLRVDTLPRYQEPHTLQYTIIVIGDSGHYPVNPNTGNPMNQLALAFETSRYVEGTNAAAETLWAGPVDIGQRIVLAPAFQVTQTAKQRHDQIMLWWAFYHQLPTTITVDSIRYMGYGYWDFAFNYYTGIYEFRQVP